MVGQGLGQQRRMASVCSGAASLIVFVLLAHLPASPQTARMKSAVAPRLALPEIVFVQTPKLVAGPLAQRFPQGSVIVRLPSSAAQKGVLRLTDGFFAAADPQVSFDGTRILFSGQKGQSDRWQLWEMSLDGSSQRQVTHCTEDCLRGAYLAAEEIAVTVQETKGTQPLSYLAVVKTEGSGFHRITFGNAPFQLETVLRDGRIVASAPWPLVGVEQQGGTRILYTLRPDGTALESFRCEHGDNAIQADAEELADGSLVFVRKSTTEAQASGELMRIRQGAAGAAPLGPRQIAFESPRQVSGKELLVARQAAAATNSPARFEIHLFNLQTGALGARIYGDPLLSAIQPTPVIPRTIPNHYWDTLNPQASAGNFISLNSYLSVDAPQGHISAQIAKVRVFTLDSNDGHERNLGDAPVEADGSFFVQVPANWPVRFALLDAKGQIISEERSWIWTRPGEERGCTGCHGDKAVAPENHWPETLRRFDTPTPLGEMNRGSAPSEAK
jgi:Hydrazine synthase alpha subunit middle domain